MLRRTRAIHGTWVSTTRKGGAYACHKLTTARDGRRRWKRSQSVVSLYNIGRITNLKKKVQQTKSSNGGHPQKTGEAWMRAAMDVVPCSRPNPGPQPT